MTKKPHPNPKVVKVQIRLSNRQAEALASRAEAAGTYPATLARAYVLEGMRRNQTHNNIATLVSAEEARSS